MQFYGLSSSAAINHSIALLNQSLFNQSNDINLLANQFSLVPTSPSKMSTNHVMLIDQPISVPVRQSINHLHCINCQRSTCPSNHQPITMVFITLVYMTPSQPIVKDHGTNQPITDYLVEVLLPNGPITL